MADYTIDCFGGGGAKGMCQIPYLVKAEEDSNGIPYCKTRDLLVGTSIGAVNSAFMATGKISAKDMSLMYKDAQKKIFSKKKWYEFPKLPLYDKQAFINIWDDVVGHNFRMGDCQTKLMITSINAVCDEYGSERNVFFKSWKPDDADRLLVDVVVNSFSAPIYFGYTCRPDERRVYVDGGAGENNLPVDEALLEAQMLGWTSPDIHLMLNAIGCMYSVDPETQDFARVCASSSIKEFLRFANPLVGGMTRSMSLSDQLRRTSYFCRHTPNVSFRYWDVEIPKKYDVIDNPKYLDYYEIVGTEMMKTPLISVN